jgi:signal peptidase II
MSDALIPSRRLTWLAFSLAVAIIAADQLSKAWVLFVLDLPTLGSVPFFGPIHLSMVWNRGVSFGLFRADHEVMRWALAAFSFGVALILAGWARKLTRPRLAIALGLIMGGAVGNLIDRVRFGAVCDFIDVSAFYFPWVFNIADSAITIGVLILLMDSLLTPQSTAETQA